MTATPLMKLVEDFAVALKRADDRRPVWTSPTSGKAYQAGIGPHPETKTIELALDELRAIDPATYGSGRIGVPYPSLRRQACDLALELGGGHWFIEAKMMRLMGDNGKPNDNILTHILSPYPEQRSAITDCRKLVASGFDGRRAILIYGYEYKGWPLEPVISAFEYLAAREVELSPRAVSAFKGLCHPIHSSGEVYGWEVRTRAA